MNVANHFFRSSRVSGDGIIPENEASPPETPVFDSNDVDDIEVPDSEIVPTNNVTLNFNPENDDILTEYHPSSGRAARLQPMKDYGRRTSMEAAPEERPWVPFRTRIDFEISELILEAALNQSQIKRLTELIHRAVEKDDEEDKFTIKNAAEMKQLWEWASIKVTPVINNSDVIYTRIGSI